MQRNLTICYLSPVNTCDSANTDKPANPEDLADFYRALHAGNPGDVAFYQRACDGASSVLELGCGWGRILQGLVKEGRHLVGIDENSAFVECAKKAAPGAEVFVGDARRLDLRTLRGERRRFDRILIPYNTLYSLGGPEGVAACLKGARDHLREEGEIWCDVYPIDDMHDALLSGEELDEDDDEPVASFEFRGAMVNVLERTEVDHLSQHLSVKYLAVSATGEVVHQQELSHDYLTSAQLLQSFEKAGLEVIGTYGGFSGQPQEETEHHVFALGIA